MHQQTAPLPIPPVQDTNFIPPAATGSALAGTRWQAVDALVNPYRLEFGNNTMSSITPAGDVTTVWVDFSGVHPACLGFPRCVVEVGRDGLATPMFFAGGLDSLYAVDCVRWSEVGDGGPMPTEQQIAEQSGVQLLWRTGEVMCLHMGRPMYQLVR